MGFSGKRKQTKCAVNMPTQGTFGFENAVVFWRAHCSAPLQTLNAGMSCHPSPFEHYKCVAKCGRECHQVKIEFLHKQHRSTLLSPHRSIFYCCYLDACVWTCHWLLAIRLWKKPFRFYYNLFIFQPFFLSG